MAYGRSRTSFGAAAALMTVILSSCGGSGGAPGTGEVDVLAAMRARHEAATTVRPFDSLADLLENVEFKMPGSPPRPLTEAVVVGRIDDVVPGRAFRIEGDDAPGGTETDFDDPDALWRTVHAVVKVERILSGATEGPSVVVGFAFDAGTPFEDIDRQLRSFGMVLLFLNESPVFAYDDAVYGTALDGALLGTVDEHGAIDLPVLEESEEARLLAGASTVGQLQSSGRRPHRVIELDGSGVRKGQ